MKTGRKSGRNIVAAVEGIGSDLSRRTFLKCVGALTGLAIGGAPKWGFPNVVKGEPIVLRYASTAVTQHRLIAERALEEIWIHLAIHPADIGRRREDCRPPAKPVRYPGAGDLDGAQDSPIREHSRDGLQEKSTGVFPPLVIRMLKVGEATGPLDTALRNVSYFYDRDVKDSIKKVQAMIEPAMNHHPRLIAGLDHAVCAVTDI